MVSYRVELRKVIAIVWSALLLLGWALITPSCQVVVPQHGWSKKWGPMVPHETFPGDCGVCHTPEGWEVLREDFSFDHQKETGFALEGAHAAAACLRCHNDRGPISVYIARGCAGCHPDPHKSSLGKNCQSCHEQTTWRPVGLISEHARTRFPLAGMHAIAPCESCHPRAPVGEFRGVPTTCHLCHERDLARATSPDHVNNGWVTGCERCHSPSGWAGADFRHDFFPLNGGHSALQCTQCHIGGNFGSIPSACFSCHQDDYQRAPNHEQFSQDCTQCHSTVAWSDAVFNHRFPLQGPHARPCSTCHQGGDTSSFTCLVCHEHRQTEMDDVHDDVNGYRYDSQACYQCHPNGRS